MTTPSPSIERIVICGGGLAGAMTAAALSRHLPSSVQITLVDGPNAGQADMLYGSVTDATAYDFNLLLGVTEPHLILDSDSAFSWGTEYARWGAEEKSWMQCFHLPPPILGGVLFHHHLLRLDLGDLEPYLVSAMAARKGVFAHPTQQGPQLLSRAEYGYQFEPRAYAALFAAAANRQRLRIVAADIASVELGEKGIASITCSDGQSLDGDLFIDCTGPDALLLSRLGVRPVGRRRLKTLSSRRAATQLGPPHRTVTAGAFGWHASTPLQGSVAHLTLYHPDAEKQALAAHGQTPEQTAETAFGRRDKAWSHNCVGIGQAAGVLEPITPAPIMLLQRDIERLLSLIPAGQDMSVEAREYNRQHEDDHTHADLFRRTLFETKSLPEGPYLDAVREEPLPEKLANKLTQFESRGLLVPYDLEPFNQEDWTILHYGMGRRPARYDRLADQVPEAELRARLAALKGEIEKLVTAMPSHDTYMSGLIAHLNKAKS